MLKKTSTFLVLYSVIMFPISRYFGWNSMIVAFPAVYIAILLVRPHKIKYFIYDALIAIAILLMALALIKKIYILAYVIMGIIVSGAFILGGIGLYKKHYGINPFDE